MTDYNYKPEMRGGKEIGVVPVRKDIIKCPVCDGQGIVSKPPWIAGDQRSWSGSSEINHVCHRCNGAGTIDCADCAELKELCGELWKIIVDLEHFSICQIAESHRPILEQRLKKAGMI